MNPSSASQGITYTLTPQLASGQNQPGIMLSSQQAQHLDSSDGPFGRRLMISDDAKTAFLKRCSNLPIFQFLIDLLIQSPYEYPVVSWTRRNAWEIRINTTAFTELWNRKVDDNMSFKNIARILKTLDRMKVATEYTLMKRTTKEPGIYRFLVEHHGNNLPEVDERLLYPVETVQRRERSRPTRPQQYPHPLTNPTISHRMVLGMRTESASSMAGTSSYQLSVNPAPLQKPTPRLLSPIRPARCIQNEQVDQRDGYARAMGMRTEPVVTGPSYPFVNAEPMYFQTPPQRLPSPIRITRDIQSERLGQRNGDTIALINKALFGDFPEEDVPQMSFRSQMTAPQNSFDYVAQIPTDSNGTQHTFDIYQHTEYNQPLKEPEVRNQSMNQNTTSFGSVIGAPQMQHIQNERNNKIPNEEASFEDVPDSVTAPVDVSNAKLYYTEDDFADLFQLTDIIRREQTTTSTSAFNSSSSTTSPPDSSFNDSGIGSSFSSHNSSLPGFHGAHDVSFDLL